ncbi:unnamed protein product [Adineta steineri]|uniref:Uncharacterized protein n=1 Tax=Adineta steineri TaxID=433720 RepID=A0A814US75_9BILA|nr:unnamed protein product [Adineta steineri]CAF3642861.1 unnamed protein product [Adineta steineri]
MHLVLFSIVALCVADNSRTQEIAIATDYLRAHVNDSLLPESAINAQVTPAVPPPVNPDIVVTGPIIAPPPAAAGKPAKVAVAAVKPAPAVVEGKGTDATTTTTGATPPKAELRGPSDAKDIKHDKDHKDGKDHKDDKKHKDHKDHKDHKEHKDAKDDKDTKDAKDSSSEEAAEDKNKSYDHEHESHHDHDATISVDVHNILDLFKEQLHETEERLLAAIHHDHKEHHPKASPAPKSYRTADR